MINFKNTLIAIAFIFISANAFTQDEKIIIDKVIATIGSDEILLSELEAQVMQFRAQGQFTSKDVYCKALEEIMVQKLLINQAKIDSITVSPSQVETQVDNRISYFISNIGSREAVEKYFNKDMNTIKNDLMESIEKQMLAQQAQQTLIANVDIAPRDITSFYNKIDKDSLPTITDQYEILQITLHPEETKKAVADVKTKLLELRQRIIDGERFATLAVIYSEDQGSATRGGELGFRAKNELVKPFANAAWSLKKDQVSNIIETEFGYHIIQVIDTKDDRVNTRHILMKPKVAPESIEKTKNKLDSIASAIRVDSIEFKMAAYRFSDDKKTYLSGGAVINPYTNGTKFEKDQLPAKEFYIINKLKPGEVSDAFLTKDEHGKDVYKIISIKAKYAMHKANLKDDYDVLQLLAKEKKQNSILKTWITEKQKKTYIKIDPKYNECDFDYDGWFK